MENMTGNPSVTQVNYLETFKSLLLPNPSVPPDIKVEIIEYKETETERCVKSDGEAEDIPPAKRSEITNEPIELSCHAFLLRLHSEYFTKALDFPGRSHCDPVRVIVGPGQGLIAKRLIRSFYDPFLLNNISLVDAVSVLQIADMVIVRKNHMEIMEQNVIDHITLSNFANACALLNEGGLEELRAKCVSRIAGYFCPLELKIYTHAEFLALDCVGLRCLLESGFSLALSEQSLMTFILEWLRFDVEKRCTENNFSSIFKTIRAKFITTKYLEKLNRGILEKLSGFEQWFISISTFVSEPGDSSGSNHGFSMEESRNYVDDEIITCEDWSPGSKKPFGNRRSFQCVIKGQHCGTEQYHTDILLIDDGVKLPPPHWWYDCPDRHCLDRSGSTRVRYNPSDTISKYPGMVTVIASVEDIPVFFKSVGSRYKSANILPEQWVVHVIVCRTENLQDDCIRYAFSFNR